MIPAVSQKESPGTSGLLPDKGTPVKSKGLMGAFQRLLKGIEEGLSPEDVKKPQAQISLKKPQAFLKKGFLEESLVPQEGQKKSEISLAKASKPEGEKTAVQHEKLMASTLTLPQLPTPGNQAGNQAPAADEDESSGSVGSGSAKAKSLKSGQSKKPLTQTEKLKASDQEEKSQGISPEKDTDVRKIVLVDRRRENAPEATPEEKSLLYELEKSDTSEVHSNDEVKILFQTGSGVVPEGSGSRGSAPVSRELAGQLARQIQEKGHMDIVDQAKIILRDQNQGEIRLVLHPESLGRVRISVSVQDNHLAGRIYVENNTVKEVFQSQLDQLTKSFTEAGYESVRLEVTVGGEGGSREEYRPEQVKLYEDSLLLREDPVPGGNSLQPPLSVQDGMNRLNIFI